MSLCYCARVIPSIRQVSQLLIRSLIVLYERVERLYIPASVYNHHHRWLALK